MNTKNVPYEFKPKDEGLKTPIDRNAEVKSKPDNRVPFVNNSKPVQKKFLGLSNWAWLIAGGILVFAVLTVAIVLAVH